MKGKFHVVAKYKNGAKYSYSYDDEKTAKKTFERFKLALSVEEILFSDEQKEVDRFSTTTKTIKEPA